MANTRDTVARICREDEGGTRNGEKNIGARVPRGGGGRRLCEGAAVAVMGCMCAAAGLPRKVCENSRQCCV